MTRTDTNGVTRTLARFAAGLRPKDVPETTRAIFHLSLQDLISVAIAGATEPVSRRVRAMVVEEGGAPQSQVIFGPRLPARAAALANGTISHALDYDDTHFDHIGHPSVAVIPAALSMAQRVGVSGRAFQDAAIVGMEVSIAVGRWLGRSHYQAGFHQTATAGAFGAAAAAGVLLRFDVEQMVNCLGLVATRASGLKSQFGTMGKPLNAGLAASNGVEAALLVDQGFRPDPMGLEAAQGFGPTHHGAGDMSALTGLGQTWRLPFVQHKFHACCHGLHAAIDALGEIPVKDADQLSRIEVHVHPRWLDVCAIPQPQTGLELKFSYAGVLGMALQGISTGRLESYTTDVARDPHVIGLGQRVHVVGDDSLTEVQARLRVTDTDGTLHPAMADLDTPLNVAQRTRRVLSKSAELIGQDAALDLRRRIIRAASPTELAAALAAPEAAE